MADPEEKKAPTLVQRVEALEEKEAGRDKEDKEKEQDRKEYWGHETIAIKQEITRLASEHAALKGEVVAVHASWDIIALGLPALYSLEPVVEGLLKKVNIERNRWGMLWRVSKAEREKREREAQRVDKALAKLQDYHHGTRDKIKNSNLRISKLEKTVKKLDRARNVSRQQIRHMESSPALQGTTNQVTLLERRVALLTAALS
ncbi:MULTISPECIES: hypothetical protein [unclassified Streptomyces]|uniref:hypothetical protein n=1 Tax=unclassified Streptomyces TaxID=2593676 RepID=UPI0036FB79F3